MSGYKVKRLSFHLLDYEIKERMPELRQSFYEVWSYRYLTFRC